MMRLERWGTIVGVNEDLYRNGGAILFQCIFKGAVIQDKH